MKKLITSIVLSTALVGGACLATGCTPTNNSSTNGDVASVEQLKSAPSFYTYGAASIGSIISAAEVSDATTETPVEGGSTTETPTEPEPPVEGGSTTETPTEPETPVEGGSTTETPAEPETPVEGGSTTETPVEPETPVEGGSTTETPAEPEQPTGGLTEEQLATVNGYMGLVENLLANGGLSYIRIESDREDYEVKEVISFSDLEGNVITYVMYYNSTLDYVETDLDDDKEETETQYIIEGVMIIDGVEYALEGRSEVETSGDESETETYFKVTLADGSYIIMEQEVEAGETELVYKVVSDKNVTEKIKFEYETENGETQLKMSVEKNGVKTTLKFSEETEQGVKVIKVTANGTESNVSFKIEVTQDERGNNVYQYTFGEKIKEMHRHRFEKGNFDDKEWGNDRWNHGEWNKGEQGNGMWQWHVDRDKMPEGTPAEGFEDMIMGNINDFINNHHGQNNRH